MACNTLSLACSSPASVTAYAPLSSASAPFVASSAPAMLCPLSSPALLKSSLSVSCSLSEKDVPAKSMGKALLTGLVAAGAALSVFTADTLSSPAAFAAEGPGTSGAERTAQKAQDLLKAADKLNVEDAPKRFGPGRVTAGGNQDAGKVAQDAGGKALSQIQDGISSIAGTVGGKKGEVESAAKNVASQAQSKVDNATGNSGPGGLFSSAKNAASQVQSKVDDATGNKGPGGLFSSAKNVANQAQNKVDDATGNSGPGGLFSSAKNAASQVQSKVDDATGNSGPGGLFSSAKNAASEAQNKVDDATGNSGPGGLFSSIKDSFQGIKEGVAQKDGAAKKTLDEATSNAKSTIMQ